MATVPGQGPAAGEGYASSTHLQRGPNSSADCFALTWVVLPSWRVLSTPQAWLAQWHVLGHLGATAVVSLLATSSPLWCDQLCALVLFLFPGNWLCVFCELLDSCRHPSPVEQSSALICPSSHFLLPQPLLQWSQLQKFTRLSAQSSLRPSPLHACLGHLFVPSSVAPEYKDAPKSRG